VRSDPSEFPIARPRTLEEALHELAAGAARPGGATPLAGATDLFVLWNAGHLPATTFVSLASVAELAQPLRWRDGALVLSALSTYTDVRRDARVHKELPLLVAASRELGAVQIQNRGTWAGNVANASPAADGVPALLAYDARLALASVRGRREVLLADYFTGYKTSVRAADELIVEIVVPVPASGARHFWRKVGTRRMQAISKVVLAAVVEHDAARRVTRSRLAFGSVAPVTVRARAVESAIAGCTLGAEAVAAALDALGKDIAPIDDIRSTRDYRSRVSANLLRACLAAELPA